VPGKVRRLKEAREDCEGRGGGWEVWGVGVWGGGGWVWEPSCGAETKTLEPKSAEKLPARQTDDSLGQDELTTRGETVENARKKGYRTSA